MIRSSVGQWNSELAGEIYRRAGVRADTLVKAGKITAADRDATWAKIVFERLTSANIPVPKAVAAQAGMEAAPSVVQGAVPTAQAAARVTAGQAAKGVLRGGWPIALGMFVLEGTHTLYKFASGDIDAKEAKRRTVRSAASNGGALSGAAGGAAIGTVILPGVGTAIGTVFGGIVGSFGAGRVSDLLT